MSPVITFALPRSGSTLLVRLLNQCNVFDSVKKIRYNGEIDIMHQFFEILVELNKIDENGVVDQSALQDDKLFLSHYHFRDSLETIGYLQELFRYYCGGQIKHCWGWKLVNYGYQKKDFNVLIDNIIELWPEVKFIFLDRDSDEIMRSVEKVEFFEDFTESKLEKQIANYQETINKHHDRCSLLSYEDMLDFSSFKEFVESMGWYISEKNYNKIINNRVAC